jgi:predicted transcriptional regulator
MKGPKSFDKMIVVRLPNDLAARLQRMTEQAPGQPPQSVLVRAALDDYIKRWSAAQTGDSATMPPAA